MEVTLLKNGIQQQITTADDNRQFGFKITSLKRSDGHDNYQTLTKDVTIIDGFNSTANSNLDYAEISYQVMFQGSIYYTDTGQIIYRDKHLDLTLKDKYRREIKTNVDNYMGDPTRYVIMTTESFPKGQIVLEANENTTDYFDRVPDYEPIMIHYQFSFKFSSLLLYNRPRPIRLIISPITATINIKSVSISKDEDNRLNASQRIYALTISKFNPLTNAARTSARLNPKV